MTTLLYSHAAFAGHETPPGHPEQSARMDAVAHALAAPEFDILERLSAPLCEAKVVTAVHASSHLERIEAAAQIAAEGDGLAALDPDTTMGPTSFEASRRAVGAALDAVDAVYKGAARNAFVAARPPGHHAEPGRAMGFCLFNAAALAAVHAREAHGARKVAVVDFDVHHGNGTEAAFWSDEATFFASSHEFPQYPGTGKEDDRGVADNIVNAPLPTGAGSMAFRRAWGDKILPALSDFNPDFIIVSAGFDAHKADPLGGLLLDEADFDWVTAQLMGVADDVCDGRLVSLLEGGYNLDALGSSVAAHVARLAGARL
ncbi:MAG: histone deacetylase family protein [Pseudomonadota bacterium]